MPVDIMRLNRGSVHTDFFLCSFLPSPLSGFTVVQHQDAKQNNQVTTRSPEKEPNCICLLMGQTQYQILCHFRWNQSNNRDPHRTWAGTSCTRGGESLESCNDADSSIIQCAVFEYQRPESSKWRSQLRALAGACDKTSLLLRRCLQILICVSVGGPCGG